MSVKKQNETNTDTGIIDSLVNTGHLSTFNTDINTEAKEHLQNLRGTTNKKLDPSKAVDPEMAKNLKLLADLVAARQYVQQESGVPGQQAWSAITQTLPVHGIDIPSNYYELDATIKSNPDLRASWEKLYPHALENIKSNGLVNQLIAKLRSQAPQQPLPRQYFNLKRSKQAQVTSRFPVHSVNDFINKFLGDVMSFDGAGQENDAISNAAIKEIQSAVGQPFEQEANSVLKYIRKFNKENESEVEIAEQEMTYLYDWLSPNVKATTGITSMSESKPKGITNLPQGIVKFNLSSHIQSGKEMTKEAASHFGNEYFLYGPTEKRVCPKLRGKFGGVGTNDVVSEYICRHHCLDGIVVDDNKTICGEALWRANVMDKFSREYVDQDGNIVGGYINNRFEINRNVPEENKMRLKPGELRKPRPAAWGNTESRLQDMRNKEAVDRNYRPNPDTSKPFNWTKDVDQNNVEIDQAERNRREIASGHQIVEYTNREQGENNPKVITAETKEPDETNPIKLVKKDCGIHFGHEPGPCSKCLHHDDQISNPKFRKGLQYSGTPFNALIDTSKQASTDEGNEIGNWPGGWLNDEWKCPQCKTIIGKNLKDDSPYALVEEHKQKCNKKESFNLKQHKIAQTQTIDPLTDTANISDEGGEIFDIEEDNTSFPEQRVIEELKAWALEPEEDNPEFMPSYKLWARWTRGMPANVQLVQEAIDEFESLLHDPNVSLSETDKDSLITLVGDLEPYATEDNEDLNSNQTQNLDESKDKNEESKSMYVANNSFNLNSYKEAKKNRKDFSYKGKKYKVNPFAVCHTTVDKDENPEKYERCVQDVKDSSEVKSKKKS